MKQFATLLPMALCFTLTTHMVLAQDPREAEIKQLENLERESVLKGDSAVLFDKIWSPKMVVNTPANVVGTVEKTKSLLRSGELNYKSFTRNIEKITFHDKVAIVMGGEIIQPQNHQVNAGKTVSRRFTHVWLYQNNSWSLIARQATNSKIE